MMSGLSAALTQRALVGGQPRHAIFFSSELAVYGIIFLVLRDCFYGESKPADMLQGYLSAWDFYSLIPVIANVSSLLYYY
jgi:hypothetical protein